MKHLDNLSSVSFDAIRNRAVFSDVYNFLDVAVAINSDKEELLDWFRRVYPRFRIENAEKKADVAYYIMVETSEGPLVITEENSHLEIRSPADINYAPSYTHLLAVNYIVTNLKSHFLLHGAVVSRNGDGLAIMGASGAGKTTLMLQLLLKKGFKFLSDERLAINRTTHLIDPYPRSIGIRENTLALLDKLELRHSEPQTVGDGQYKWFVDISKISEDGVGKSCHLKYLVFLVDPLNDTEKNDQPLELAVDEINDQLMEKLRSLAKGREVCCEDTKNSYVLSFYPEAEAPSALEFERLCQNCGVWFLGVRKLGDIRPDFRLTPEIQRIPWHTATMRLLNGLERGLHNDFCSNPGQAFLELAGLLEDVKCYKLYMGKLDEMAEHICNVVLNSGCEPIKHKVSARK